MESRDRSGYRQLKDSPGSERLKKGAEEAMMALYFAFLKRGPKYFDTVYVSFVIKGD